ncbi:MAG: ChrR family anti-sigma-E factor, partial [Aestuariivirgaceae bacterium]
FAAGALTPAIAVVVSSHISMCPACRRKLENAEAVGGALFEAENKVHLSHGSINNVLEQIEVEQRARPGRPADAERKPRHMMADDMLPFPVASLLETRLPDVKWKRAGRGIAIHQIDLGDDTESKLFLMKIQAGRAVPEHGHGASELTLVLSGAYTDECGRFARGDVADLDEDIEHQPVVDKDEDCICLVAIEQPTRFTGLVPRILQPLVGI